MKIQLIAALVYGGIGLFWGIVAWRITKKKPPSAMGWRGEVNWLVVLSCQWLFCALYALRSSRDEIELLGDLIFSLLFLIPLIVLIGLHVWWRITGSTKPEGTGETQDVD